MFSISIQRAERVRRYTIRSTDRTGWEVSLEEDDGPTRRIRYDDWHRVERALVAFRREVADLTAQGWEIRSPSP